MYNLGMQGGVDFEVTSKLGIAIRVTASRWQLISEHKHPEIKGEEKEIVKVLRDPIEVRQSKKDSGVYLYYGKQGKYFYCLVTKHLTGRKGFLITAYLTEKIKEGKLIWRK